TTPGNMELNPDFKEFLQSLNENEVRYLVVGGYAVAFHGHPRYSRLLHQPRESSTIETRRRASSRFGRLG
ncbi:MAG: hypothetical protein KA170_08860, partial [Candidatus Promineofilum sp.]|nr:hypothetical protein [Promineifilum sp.]